MKTKNRKLTTRSTRAVVAARVQEVFRLRLAGATLENLRQFAAETDVETGRPWHISERQLWRYVQESNELLTQNVERRADVLMNLHLARREMLYATAFQTGDLRAALAVLKDSAELCNLYPAAKVVIDEKPRLTVEEMTDAELNALIGDYSSKIESNGTAD